MAPRDRHRLRDLLTPRVAYVDTHAPADPLWWVIGTQRSGTTWLGELIDPDQRMRTIFEPFHTVHSGVARRLGLPWGAYVPPGTDHPGLARTVDAIASGHVRDAWTDRQNRRRHYTSRMVKDVTATNLVPWIARHRPDDRVVLILRHPFAVVWSLLEVPWASGRDDTDALFADAGLREAIGPVAGLDGWIAQAAADAFVNRTLKWCLENALPLRAAGDGEFAVVHYEHLVADPAGACARLGIAAPGDPTRPSSTDFRRRADAWGDDGATLVTDWQAHVTPAQVETGVRILDAFGLTTVYDADPWPRPVPA